MIDSAQSIDQAIFDAMQAVDQNRPAIIRPYLKFDEIPTPEKALADYYQDKAIDKRLKVFSQEISRQEKALQSFLSLGDKTREALGAAFAENKDKIEARHCENLAVWAVKLENTAKESSAEGMELLKKLAKQSRVLTKNKPERRKQVQELFGRIAAIGEKATDEVYDMALFLRALRAEYDSDKSESVYFTDGAAMKAYLKSLIA